MDNEDVLDQIEKAEEIQASASVPVLQPRKKASKKSRKSKKKGNKENADGLPLSDAEEINVEPGATVKPRAKRRKKTVAAKTSSSGAEGDSPVQVVVAPEDIRVTVRKKGGLSEEVSLDSKEAGIESDLQGAQVQLDWSGPVQPKSSQQAVQTLESATQLPLRASKVRNIDGEIRNVATSVIPGKVIVQGIVHLQVFLVLTDNVIHHQNEDIPFSSFVDIPGATPGMDVQAEPRIEKILFDLSPDGTSLLKKIILEIFVKVSQSALVSPELGAGPLLLLPRVVGEGTGQTLAENLVALGFPALKVSGIRGEIRNITVDIIADKVIVQGVAHQQIFYVDQNNLARHQGEDVNFSAFVDIPGAAPGQDAKVQARIAEIVFELVSPSQLRQKVFVEIAVKVTESNAENVVAGQGLLYLAEQVVGERSAQMLKENVAVLNQPAEKIHEIIGEIRNATAEIIPDKVIVQGVLRKQIFFIGPGAVEFHQTEDAPFSLLIDLPGAVCGQNAHLQFTVENILFRLESPTSLRQKAIIRANAVVTETVQINLAEAAGPLYELKQVVGEGVCQILLTRRQPVNPQLPEPPAPVVDDAVLAFSEQIIRTQQIIAEKQAEFTERAVKIWNVGARVTDLNAIIVPDNDVLIEGSVNADIAYVNTDNIVQNLTESVPFSLLASAPGKEPETVLSVNVEIETIVLTLSSDGSGLRLLVVLMAELRREAGRQTVTVVKNVSGPGISQQTVNVVADVFDPSSGEIIPNQALPVVLDVSGPDIALVEKKQIVLQIQGEEKKPLDVVTRVGLRRTPCA